MNLKESILKTIAFFDLFDFPLTAEEIEEYLFDYRKPVHIKEIKGSLDEMAVQGSVFDPEAQTRREGVISRVHNFYTLKGRERLVDTRKARKFIAEKLWGRTRQYGQYLTKVPFVKMVAVCNNLAYDNPNEQSDIDLFIVIDEGRLWTSRLIITSILHFFGVRRYKDKIAGRFCLSFFVTPSAMDMERIKLDPHDPYLAYWTKTLSPIYGEKTYLDFVEKNKDWLKKHYDLEFSETSKKQMSFIKEDKLKRFFEWLLKGRVGNFIESMVKKVFKKRTLKKSMTLDERASVVISDTMLKFHNIDRRKDFYETWEKIVDKSLKELERMNEETDGSDFAKAPAAAEAKAGKSSDSEEDEL